MKLLWLDLNSSYAHSSLALPALHAQIANNTDIEWCTVSATINENTGSVVNQSTVINPTLSPLPTGYLITSNSCTSFHAQKRYYLTAVLYSEVPSF